MATVIRSARMERDPLLLAQRPRLRSEETLSSEDVVEPEMHDESIGQDQVHSSAELLDSVQDDEDERVLREAFQTGFDEGLAQGRAEGQWQAQESLTQQREKLDQCLQRFTALLESLQTTRAQLLEDAEDSLVEIAFEAVCKVLGEAMHLRDNVVSTVRCALRPLQNQKNVALHVAPRDHTWLSEQRDTLIQGYALRDIELVADERVEMGGCLLQTTEGNLDARLEIQLRKLAQVLLSTRMQSRETES